MCRIKLIARESLLLALTTVLCMAAGTVAADGDLTWPIRPDLKSHDLNVSTSAVPLTTRGFSVAKALDPFA